MNQKLDLRGKLCPEPVIAVKKALDQSETTIVEALVDDEICVANLERLAKSQKAGLKVRAEAGYYTVLLSKGASFESSPPAQAEQSLKTGNATGKVATVVFISSDRFGQGDPDFSKTLLLTFLQSYFAGGHKPRAILLANSGVTLMRKDSSSRQVLDDFKKAGTDVLACGLCVEFYGLKADIDKEQITNMFAICEYLTAADKLIQL